MPRHAELPEEPFAGGPSPANDPSVPDAPSGSFADFDDEEDIEAEPDPVRPPRRFGRLALWMASATALGVGVLGTVAYSVWFNQDQRVYAEAMTSARQTLGVDQPVLAATQSSGVVEAPSTVTHPENIKLAGSPPALDRPGLSAVAAAPAAIAEDDTTERRATPSSQSGNRANRAAEKPARTAQANQNVKRHAPPAKAEPGLFARVGAFFHRVSYRRNATSGQREEYSRP
ncbi:hypothetical protein [Caballeronia grimmiae]|uniref:Uncharacterized protein n=1 Tax=Caballeronia grimmiae TaxID=1071679 RepID=A0A069PAL2_9BURK|nr:hypothetical protein [Caballeronia grimmiae]KDR34346.1 hypothetical protein BG57_06540 [Caballeronia grimmiae]GGD50845.1 hypothetical protein GCM10010985_00730 [Caballeronia grimmiae]